MNNSCETWKKILDFPDYKVSNFGRINSIKYGREKILKPSLNKGTGYFRVTLLHNGIRQCFDIHAIVAKHFLTKSNLCLEINHKNGDKSDNRVKNLEYVTRSENIKHSFDIGLRNIGEFHHSAKLSLQQCTEIVDLYKQGTSQKEISDKFLISQACVSNILNNKRSDYNFSVKSRKSGAIGERHGRTKLTDQQAKHIKYSKLSTQELVNIHGVSSQIIYRIRSGKSWSHI